MERTTNPSVDVVPMAAATAAVITATSSRSSAGFSATGAATGAGAGLTAGAAAFFSSAFFLLNFFSIAGIKLKQDIIRLMRIRT